MTYLKAKSLCKLKRYSESLQQLARLTNLKDKVSLAPRHQLKLQFYEAVCLMKTLKYIEAIQVLNALLAWDIEQIYGQEEAKKKHFLTQVYGCRAKASEELQDYVNAAEDYTRLIELCQNLPTEKVFEYMTARTAIKAKMQLISKPKVV